MAETLSKKETLERVIFEAIRIMCADNQKRSCRGCPYISFAKDKLLSMLFDKEFTDNEGGEGNG